MSAESGERRGRLDSFVAHPFWRWTRDFGLGAAIVLSLWLTQAPIDGASRVLQWSLGGLAVAGVLVARRFPLLGVLLAAGATGVAWSAGVTSDPFVLVGFAVFRLAERRGTRSFPLWTMAGAVIVLVVSLGFGAEGTENRFRTMLLSMVVLAASWALGVRTRRVRTEAAARSRAEERLRLARDVHDVLSHSLGVIGVRAGVAAHVTCVDETALRDTLRDIEEQSRSSLAELRQLLDRERGSTDASSSAPLTAALRDIAAAAERSGLVTRLDVAGDADGIPPAAKTTVLRVVQEAVTNVIRHASASSLTFTLRIDAGRVEVEIRDDGRTGSGVVRHGNGLIGMRERVEILGGTLSAGYSGSGFTVSARIPLAVPMSADGTR